MQSSTQARYVHDYASSHRHPINEAIHCVCVPAIVFAVIGALLAAGLAVAVAAIAAAIIYYVRLSFRAGLEMALLLSIMLALWLTVMPTHHVLIYAALIFAAAWVGQFIGHAIEGAKPSFLKDLQFLMIGPLYVIEILRNKLRAAEAK
jgi:uncharacterized membrane protein YGL010W